MNLLVTGGTGYLGCRAVDTLLGSGHSVVLLTRDPQKARDRFGDSIRTVAFDFSRPRPLSASELPRDLQVILHMAANLRFFGPWRVLHTLNVASGDLLLRLARRQGIPRMVFTSSIEAMGPVALEALPARENDPCSPVSNYGHSKLEAERTLIRAAGGFRLQLVILRIANVYDESDHSFPAVLLRGLAAGAALRRFFPAVKDLRVHPIHISDCVEAIRKACVDGREGTYNVAGPGFHRIEEIADLLCTSRGVPVPTGLPSRWAEHRVRLRVLHQRWRRKGDLLTYWASGRFPAVHRGYSTQAAEDGIQFRPRISLREGLAAFPGRLPSDSR